MGSSCGFYSMALWAKEPSLINSKGTRLKPALSWTARDLVFSSSEQLFTGHRVNQSQQGLDSRFLAWKEDWDLFPASQFPQVLRECLHTCAHV